MPLFHSSQRQALLLMIEPRPEENSTPSANASSHNNHQLQTAYFFNHFSNASTHNKHHLESSCFCNLDTAPPRVFLANNDTSRRSHTTTPASIPLVLLQPLATPLRVFLADNDISRHSHTATLAFRPRHRLAVAANPIQSPFLNTRQHNGTTHQSHAGEALLRSRRAQGQRRKGMPS
jgi:hypothetical protein